MFGIWASTWFNPLPPHGLYRKTGRPTHLLIKNHILVGHSRQSDHLYLPKVPLLTSPTQPLEHVGPHPETLEANSLRGKSGKDVFKNHSLWVWGPANRRATERQEQYLLTRQGSSLTLAKCLLCVRVHQPGLPGRRNNQFCGKGRAGGRREERLTAMSKEIREALVSVNIARSGQFQAI